MLNDAGLLSLGRFEEISKALPYDRIHRIEHRSETFAYEAVVDTGTALAAAYDPGVSENGEMLGHGRRVRSDERGELSDSVRLLAQEACDIEARRVTKRLKRFGAWLQPQRLFFGHAHSMVIWENTRQLSAVSKRVLVLLAS